MIVHKRALARLAVFAMAGAMLLSACSGSKGANSGAKQKVRFTEVIHSVFYAPQYVAQAKGYFEAEGIELDFSTAQGSDKGVAALLAGTADIALVGPETTVFVHNQDTPNKVKIFAQMTDKDGSFLVAKAGTTGFQWSDLKGKSVIGWRQGSMPQLVAEAVLKQKGLASGDLNYVTNIAAPAMVGAFVSDQGDYVQVFEPLVSQLEREGKGVQVAYLGDVYGKLPYTGYVATEKYLQEHADLVQRYTNAVWRATLYLLKADPEVVGNEIGKYFEGTDPKLLASSIKRYREAGAWRPTPVMTPAEFDKMQDLMIAGGVLEAGKRAPFEAIGVNTFAEKAFKEIKEP